MALAAAQDRRCHNGSNPIDDPLIVLDHATRVLYERVRAVSQNGPLFAALEGNSPSQRPLPHGLRIVLVPGIFYRDHPETGADGAVLRDIAERLDIPFDTIPVDGTEGLDVAADLINTWLLAAPADSRILLFSLSKGSAEVRHALSRDRGQEAFRQVNAWVSVSGLPFGTPSVEMVLDEALPRAVFSVWFWLKRWKLDRVRELLRHRPAAPFLLPAWVQFVQIAAFPLHVHLRDRRSRRLRKRLAPFGPNDGFALLDELAALPGMLYPVWGADHYLRGTSDLPLRIQRLIEHLADLRNNFGEQPSRSGERSR